MKAMILAAGYGTRLRPLTFTVPKAMVPLCGRPLVAWAVESLLHAGVRDFIVNLHHLPEPIERFLRKRFGSQARFEFSHEPEILGTGGGVRKVRSQLHTEDEFFLVNGDTVQFPPYDALHRLRQERDAVAALTLRHAPADDRFTPVHYADGLVTGFGKGMGDALMFSGAHVISRRIFDDLPEKDFFGIVDEVYQPLIAKGRERVAALIDDGPWFDIGTARRYMTASRALLDLTVHGQLQPAPDMSVAGDSLTHGSSTSGSQMKRSIVGARSIVEGTLRDSVVWDGCHVGQKVILNSCIVAHGVEIAEPMELRNVVVCRDDGTIPREGAHRFDHGLVLSDI